MLQTSHKPHRMYRVIDTFGRNDRDIESNLFRSASSTSANIAEAKYAESDADFVHKLEIAQKEANETETWLTILSKSGIIDENTFKALRNKCGKIRRMPVASMITVKSKMINAKK